MTDNNNSREELKKRLRKYTVTPYDKDLELLEGLTLKDIMTAIRIVEAFQRIVQRVNRLNPLRTQSFSSSFPSPGDIFQMLVQQRLQQSQQVSLTEEVTSEDVKNFIEKIKKKEAIEI